MDSEASDTSFNVTFPPVSVWWRSTMRGIGTQNALATPRPATNRYIDEIFCFIRVSPKRCLGHLSWI
jgi:hypothetical protein